MLLIKSMSWSATKQVLTILLVVFGLAYPAIVYYGLTAFSPRIILIVLLVLIAMRGIIFAVARQYVATVITLAVAVVLILAGWVSELIAVWFYPVIVSLIFGAIFTATLLSKTSMIERIARLKTPNIDDYAISYTRKLTIIWIVFFTINAMIAAWTVFYGSREQWFFYNGFLSYVLIAALFIGEQSVRNILRTRHERNLDKKVKISSGIS